jgi:hypothetical protein
MKTIGLLLLLLGLFAAVLAAIGHRAGIIEIGISLVLLAASATLLIVARQRRR